MRILVAEDEIDLAEALKMMLEMQKYSVEVVHDGGGCAILCRINTV